MSRLRNDMSWGVLCSLALHGLIIFLGLWGFSFWKRMPSEPARPIPIDVVTVDQLSQAPRPKPKPEKKSPPPPPEEKTASAEQPEPLIEVEEKKQPPLPPKNKPEVEKNPSDVPPPTKPKEEPKTEKKPDKQEKKTEKKPDKKSDKVKENAQTKKKDAAKKQKKKDFLSVLKNLEDVDEETIADPIESDLNSQTTTAAEQVSDRLTISEIDLIKRQLMGCWNVPAGAKDAKNLIIVLDLSMNRDGTVQQASLVPSKSSTNHPFYQAGAESALRAVRNPRCTPLKLPPDRYEAWKSFEITFNPKNVR